MPDHKEDQNDAGDRDNHFLPNRRAIKNCQNIHFTSGRRSSGACSRLWMRLGASRLVPAPVFPCLRIAQPVGDRFCSPARGGTPPEPATVETKSSFTCSRIGI